jgi:hypothetical protein
MESCLLVAHLSAEEIDDLAGFVHLLDNWETCTADGMFTNRDPVQGHRPYGAEIVVDPALQSHDIGSHLWWAQRALAERWQL